MNIESEQNNEEFANWHPEDALVTQTDIGSAEKGKLSGWDRLKNSRYYKTGRNAIIYAATAGAVLLAGELKDISDREKVQTGPDQTSEKDATLNSVQAEKLRSDRSYIEQEMGPNVMQYLEFKSSVNSRELPNTPSELVVVGNEQFNIPPEALKELWQDGVTYPKGWIQNEADTVQMVELGEIEKLRQGKDNLEYAGTAQENDQTSLGKIRLSVPELENGKDLLPTVDWTFSHEITHLNGGFKKMNLPFNERADLLVNVMKRVRSGNDFKGIGWDYINRKKTNPEQLAFYQAEEYFAHIGEYYFSFPDILKEESPEDFALIDEYVKKQDPNFDPFKAKKLRNQIYNKYQSK